ncbi:MAG: hypothetical protein WA989_12295 [Henriciella sp.]|uniref:hypothetical protein n=1 Tax=Henriciella sp. TaxID=1968823 RepID=UPI003C72F7B6
MTLLIKTLVAGAALATAAATASAQSEFTARFDYSPDASIEVTYADFERTARKACSTGRETGTMARRAILERSCVSKLMDDAVEATNLRQLQAFHDTIKGDQVTARKFAARR